MRPASLLALLALWATPLGAQDTTGTPPGRDSADPGRTQEAPAEPGSELRVWLLTVGAGDEVWERYGHNAIRLLDTSTGHDVSYNWGIFDFQQVDFIPRFLQGRMLYSMAVFPTGPMVDAYGRANREIVQQELALSPAQKQALRDFAERNALPENRDYTYQYFTDNCSTRVRDVLDLVLDGALQAEFSERPSPLSYRGHAKRLSETDPLVSSGLDILLGTRTDAPISIWDEMFVPMTLRDALRDVRIRAEDGTTTPLVLSEQVVVRADRAPEPATPASRLLAHLLVGLAIAGMIWMPGRAQRTGGGRPEGDRRGPLPAWLGGVAATLWSALAGLLGLLLVALLFTDHTFAYWNENLFVFNPLALVVAVLWPLSASRGGARAALEKLVPWVLGIAVVGLLLQALPWLTQANANFYALALPAHAAMLVRLRGSGSLRTVRR